MWKVFLCILLMMYPINNSAARVFYWKPNAERQMTLTLVTGVRKLGESGSIILGSLN